MASRMERYTSKENESVASRALKNQRMYEDLYTNATYTTFSSMEPSVNVIDLSDVPTKNVSRREAYQKSKGVATFGAEEAREIRNYDFEYQKPETATNDRDFDINHVLEEAKRNREDEDGLERKRKLKTTEYNILAELNEEKMKEYQNNKDVLSKEEEKNLEELIHTITSKTMAHDVNEILEREKEERKKASKKEDYLLDDLMPTKFDETIISGDVFKELEEYTNLGEGHTKVEKEYLNISLNASDLQDIQNNMDNSEELGKLENSQTIIDKSFYTRSMDLSKGDLMREEDVELFKEEKPSIIGKVIISIFILCLIAAIAFVVWQYLLK